MTDEMRTGTGRLLDRRQVHALMADHGDDELGHHTVTCRQCGWFLHYSCLPAIVVIEGESVRQAVIDHAGEHLATQAAA